MGHFHRVGWIYFESVSEERTINYVFNGHPKSTNYVDAEWCIENKINQNKTTKNIKSLAGKLWLRQPEKNVNDEL